MILNDEPFLNCGNVEGTVSFIVLIWILNRMQQTPRFHFLSTSDLLWSVYHLAIWTDLVLITWTLIEDASARPPHPEIASPANSLPAFPLGVYAWFLVKYSCILQAYWPHTILIMRSIFNRFFNEFLSIFDDLGTFLAFGGPSGSIFSKAFQKLRHGGRAPLSKSRFLAIFGSQPEPQNRPKMDPRAKKCVRRRRRKRFLSVVLAVAVRSRSLDRC